MRVDEAVGDPDDTAAPRPTPSANHDADAGVGPDEASTSLGTRALGWFDHALPHAPFAVIVVFYFWYFSWLSLDVHYGYGTSGFDIGLYDQGVYLLSRFDAPFVTIMGRNMLGDHTSFIMLAFVPFYWIAPSAAWLLAGQTLVMALGAIPVYLLALKRLGSVVLATALGAAFLLHPALGWTNLENFHPDAFLVLFMSLAIYAAIEDRHRLFVVSAVLALLVKEDVVLILLPLAVWFAIRRNRVTGIAVALAAVSWALFCTQVVMKNLIGTPTLNTWRIPFGGVRGSIETLAQRPGEWGKYLLDDNRPWYVWQMLFPTGFVFLLQPEIAATAVLVLTANVVSTFVYQHLIEYHYSMAILPALALGTVWAVAHLRKPAHRSVAVAVVAFCSLWSCYLWGLWPFSLEDYPRWGRDHPSVEQIAQIQDQLPDDAVVSSWHSYIPHVAHRERIYQWPTPFRAAYWGTFDQEGQELRFSGEIEYLLLPTTLSPDTAEVLERIRDDFAVVDQNDTTTLYRRRGLPADS